MSETPRRLSYDYLQNLRQAWAVPPPPGKIYTDAVAATQTASMLFGHIDALDAEIERIKMDRDALRDELETLRPKTVTIPGPHHVVTSRMTATPLGDLVADVDKRTRELHATVMEIRRHMVEINTVVDQHQTRLDSIGKNH